MTYLIKFNQLRFRERIYLIFSNCILAEGTWDNLTYI